MTDIETALAKALKACGYWQQDYYQNRDHAQRILATEPMQAIVRDAAIGKAIREWVESDGSISRHVDIEGGIGMVDVDLFDSNTGDIYARGDTLDAAMADAMRQVHDEPSFVAELPEDDR